MRLRASWSTKHHSALRELSSSTYALVTAAQQERKQVLSEVNMVYRNTADLPESVRHVMPEHAQHIYFEAFNHAWGEYKDKKDRRGNASRVEVAHKVAWTAVKRGYIKDEASGKWREKY